MTAVGQPRPASSAPASELMWRNHRPGMVRYVGRNLREDRLTLVQAGGTVSREGAPRTILNDGSEVVMSSGARTPEELETLFEDTLVLRDGQALAALFEDRAVLVAEHQEQARGGAAIAPLALERWSDQRTYVANPQWVVQTHDLALIVAERVIHVAHRGRDGAWRYAITLVPRDSPSAHPERAGGESVGDGRPGPC